MAQHDRESGKRCKRCAQSEEEQEAGCPIWCGECGEKLTGYLRCKCGTTGEEHNAWRRSLRVQLEMTSKALADGTKTMLDSSEMLAKANEASERADKMIEDLQAQVETLKTEVRQSAPWGFRQ